MTTAHELVKGGRLARPLTYGDWLCGCEGCAYAVKLHTDQNTHTPLALVVKRACGRDVIDALHYLRHPAETLDDLLEHVDDYIREIFIGSPEVQAQFRRLGGKHPVREVYA